MNVTVFGTTGAIGSLTVDELLANGHTVTAYARNPNKIPPEWGYSQLTVVPCLVNGFTPRVGRRW